jgi:hypothetical protein
MTFVAAEHMIDIVHLDEARGNPVYEGRHIGRRLDPRAYDGSTLGVRCLSREIAGDATGLAEKPGDQRPQIIDCGLLLVKWPGS